MPWSRRHLLRSLGAMTALSLAGCSGSDPAGSTTTTRRTPRTTTTATTSDDQVVTAAWTSPSFEGSVTELWLPNRPPPPQRTGGPLIAATDAGEVAALHIGDGHTRWQHATKGETTGGPQSVRLAGGTLYATSETVTSETLANYVEALDPETGDHRWTFEAGEYLTPIGVAADRLFLRGYEITAPPDELGVQQDPSGDGWLHAVDISTGEELWHRSVPRLWDATVAPHGLYVVGERSDGPDAGTVHAFAFDGEVRWSKRPGPANHAAVRPLAGGVVVGTDDQVGFYAPDGTREWSRTVGRAFHDLTVETDGPYEDTIFAAIGSLLALTPDGDERFRVDADVAVLPRAWQSPVYADGDGSVHAIDPDTGDRLWQYRPDNAEHVSGLAVVDEGVLVHHGVWTDTEFGVVSADQGRMVELEVTPEPYAALVSLHDRVFVGSGRTVQAADVEP